MAAAVGGEDEGRGEDTVYSVIAAVASAVMATAT